MSIGNTHSTIMARRKRAKSARTDRIWSRIVRRMVVVLCEEKPAKSASFATHALPERKFAASLAVRAVRGELFSTANSLLTGKITGKSDHPVAGCGAKKRTLSALRGHANAEHALP
jgi:hypothetical protein